METNPIWKLFNIKLKFHWTEKVAVRTQKAPNICLIQIFAWYAYHFSIQKLYQNCWAYLFLPATISVRQKLYFLLYRSKNQLSYLEVYLEPDKAFFFNFWHFNDFEKKKLFSIMRICFTVEAPRDCIIRKSRMIHMNALLNIISRKCWFVILS